MGYHGNMGLTSLHPSHPHAANLGFVRGDPGFFGNLFRGIAHIGGGLIKGLITGGPIGAITGAVSGAIGGTASNIGAATLEAGGSGSALTPALRAAHARALATHGIGVMGPGGGVQRHLRGMGLKRRRMNWANGKALSRAGRRVTSFLHHAKKFIKLTHPKAVGVHLKFHHKKRRTA